MIEFILWGTKKDNPKYMEEIIIETTDLIKLEKAHKWSKENGFVNLRIQQFNKNSLKQFNEFVNIWKGF
jgi:hypothetical protein